MWGFIYVQTFLWPYIVNCSKNTDVYTVHKCLFPLPVKVLFTAIHCSLIFSLLCHVHFHISSVCKFSISFLLFIRLCLIFIADIINVMIHFVNLWPLSMWRVRKVEKVAKYARSVMSLEQKLDVLDRLACGESCAFVSTFVCINESVIAMMW